MAKPKKRRYYPPLEYERAEKPGHWGCTHARVKGVLGASLCRAVDTDEPGVLISLMRKEDTVTCAECGEILAQHRRIDYPEPQAQEPPGADFYVQIDTRSLKLSIPCGHDPALARRCYREVVDQMLDADFKGTFTLTRDDSILDIVHVTEGGRRFCIGGF